MDNSLENYIKLLEHKEKYVEKLNKDIDKTYREIDEIENNINKLKYNNNIENEEFINKVNSILNKKPYQLYYKDLGNYPIFDLNTLDFDLYKLSIEDLNDILNDKIARTFNEEWTVFIATDKAYLTTKRDKMRYGYR